MGRQWNNCSPLFCTRSTIIQSGPGAELLFEFFMACFMCVMLKKISEELVWFSSKTESISSSISCLNCKSNSFFPIFSMWNFWSFSDIFLSSKMWRPNSVSWMGSTMLFVFLPRTLSYLCQNWVESLDLFKNFVLDLYCLSFASERQFGIFPWLFPFFVSLLEIVLIYTFSQTPSSLFWQLQCCYSTNL